MKQEARECQNCRSAFTIEPEDFRFYAKLSVPPPTFCPKCRFQRRLAFFNLVTLYKRVCGLCNKEFISMYAPEAPYVVYCPRCWWSDEWDHFQYGRDYDFSRPFFEQFNELLHAVPLLGLSIDLQTAEVSPYNNHCGHLKNCYLIFFADFNEDSGYGFYVIHSRNVFDCSTVLLGELSYDCMHLYKSNRCVGCRGNVTESLNCAFLRDCDNCQDCFASANLRNKKYYIFNKPYTKEAYAAEMKKWDLGSYALYQKAKQCAEEHWKKFPPRPEYTDFSVNASGSYVFESKNSKECYDVAGAEDSAFLAMMYDPPIKDCYDVTGWGNNVDRLYEGVTVGEHAANIRFCFESGINLYNAEYSKLSTGGSNHFGCVGVRKGDYCIFNKKYPKEDFEKLREKIIDQMKRVPYADSRGRVYRYGEFFPIEMSPAAYNETVAQKFFPLKREDIEREGYLWREPEVREYSITKRPADVPDHIRDVPDSITGEVIGCTRCGKGFKVIPMELSFLRKMNLPIPRACPFCRIGDKLDAWVKNLTLSERICHRCTAAFRAPYTAEDAPDILCRKCYLETIV